MILFDNHCYIVAGSVTKENISMQNSVSIILIFELFFTETKLTPIQFGNRQKMDGPTEQCDDPIPPTSLMNCSREFVRTSLSKFFSVWNTCSVFGENFLEGEKVEHEYDSTVGLKKNILNFMFYSLLKWMPKICILLLWEDCIFSWKLLRMS